MVERRALVMVGGRKSELPIGDTLAGVSGSVSLAATRIRRTTNQSMPTGAGWTDVIWESSAYQIGGAFWTSGATITAGVTGLLQLFVEGTMDGSGLLGTINAEMRILLNGTDEIAADFKQVFVNVPASLWCMAQRQFAATDTFKVQVRHTNATAVNLLVEGNHSPDFILAQVGGAKGDPATLTTVEVNLGSTPRRSGSFEVAGVGMTAGKAVAMAQAVGPYTGKGTLADECEMDSVLVSASVTGATQITAYWQCRGVVVGNHKFNYQIGG